MKRKIRLTVLATVVFALVILTSSFIAIMNLKEINQTKEELSIYNELFIAIENNNGNVKFANYRIKNEVVRFTVIDKEGNVIFDTAGEVTENHKDRTEIIDAFKKGTAYSTRYSSTLQKNMVYCATKIDENTVLRSSISVSAANTLSEGYLKYFILIIIGVVILSVFLSEKLVRVIIYPVKELEIATDKIANGELDKRAKVYNDDEIGSLARTFNEMADQLQFRINDNTDKKIKLEAILESMESGVIAISQNMQVMLINPYAKKLFGIKEDIIGKDIRDYIIDHEILDFSRNITNINTKEIKLFHPVEREVRVKKAPIIREKESVLGIVISVQDITDIKRLENMRSQFVANVSHELKTPLTSIKGFSETLRFVDDDVTKNKFLDIIDKETERLTLLINDILILSNIENMNSMKNDEFRPNEIIYEAINMVKKEAADKNIKITTNCCFNKPLIGDSNKFYQIILNLLANAIKYSNNDSNIDLITKEDKGKFIMVVKDEGIGIPKEDLPRIFERFYRVDKSRTTRGTGLGLAIVKHIVKLFNGDIFVESKLGEGSKFTVVINNIKD